MNRRDRAVVAFLALVLLVIGAALAVPRQPAAAEAEPTPEATPPPPVTYREGVVGIPQSITPVTARTRAERTLVGLVFSGLVKLGPGTSYQPDLAESWSSDETGRTWTFRIRDDAVWQDGEPVTAEDVVYTLGALKSPDAAGSAAAAWADVSVQAVDDKTVALSAGTANGGMLAAATQPLLPAHLLSGVPYADLAASDFARLPVGSGPFSLVDLDDTRAILVPASGLQAPAEEGSGAPYVGAPAVLPDESAAPAAALPSDSLATPFPRPVVGAPEPYLDDLEVRFYPDETALAAALRDGEVDGAAGLSAGPVAKLSAVPGIERHRYPTTTLSAVLLNLRPVHRELRNAKVRAALLAGIDRDRLVAGVLGGNAMRADALVPPGSWAFDAASAGSVKFDRKAAAQALQKAGWSRKGGSWVAPGAKRAYPLEILSVSAEANPRLAAVADAVRDDWRALGFDARLVEVKASDLVARLREGDYTAAVVDIAEGLEPDLYPLLASSQVRSSGTNLAGYQDTALDRLLEAARKPGTPEQRAAAWKPLLAALATREPILPLAWNDEVMLARGLEGDSPRLIATPGDRFWDVLAWRLAADR